MSLHTHSAKENEGSLLVLLFLCQLLLLPLLLPLGAAGRTN